MGIDELTARRWARQKTRFYCFLYAQVTELARRMGYAVGLHGSLQRDLDLIAVPWTDEAVDPFVLAEAIAAGVHGYIVNDESADICDFTKRNPQPKPHGRLAWAIQLGGGPYIDLSVMPRVEKNHV